MEIESAPKKIEKIEEKLSHNQKLEPKEKILSNTNLYNSKEEKKEKITNQFFQN